MYKKGKEDLGILILLGILSLAIIIGAFYSGYRFSQKHNSKNVQKICKKNKKSNKNKKNNVMDKRESIIPGDTPGEYKPWQDKANDGKKIAYLTFDDGPSVNTNSILSILNQNNIKGTFFLIGKNAERNPSLVKEEAANGETIGNHTYSHQLNYKESPEQFVDDLNKCESILKSILGADYNLKFARFPGGSFGKRLEPFRNAVTKAGYKFIDWNDETGDADGYDLPVQTLLNNLKKNTYMSTIVVLMHDAGPKTTTVQALPQVIQYLKSKGYTFETLK